MVLNAFSQNQFFNQSINQSINSKNRKRIRGAPRSKVCPLTQADLTSLTFAINLFLMILFYMMN